MTYDQAMGQALRLANQAAGDGEVPVGAVILDATGTIIAKGRNRRQGDGNPIAHAEIEAIIQAARNGMRVEENGRRIHRARLWNLEGCTLVVTLEPCPMCAGAVLQAHLSRVVFGAWDGKLGACGSVWDILRDPHVGERPEVIGGVREQECGRLLSDFFAAQRIMGATV